ncbi:hypothetical protein [Enterovirga rhinocerotis]|uniref:Uncharacterized protein n=1 Tax=Enterovirga rhinocerotis TaxID=1339210 RepID=A0A4V3DX30_9HYPH|nr:hypothetical protein [Enterovirga rhinocerotis]TDR87129.1 hypothetical protein EV668_4209 [Enterovirga rhinocerotis]
MLLRTILVLGAGALAAASLSTSASAFGRLGGNSEAGDSYLNDAVKNPALLDPNSKASRERYRAYYPSEGWDDRWAAWEAKHGRVYRPGSR